MSVSSGGANVCFLDVDLAIRQTGGAQAMQGMLPIVEESLARDIPRISELLAQGDVEGASRVLHSLKGFIPIFCGAALSTLVAQVHELSKTGSVQDVTAAYAPLRADLNALLADVANYRRDHAA